MSGVGVSLLPRYMAGRHMMNGDLIQVLPNWSGIAMPVHAVFASTRYMDPKVRAFVDLCRDAFENGGRPSDRMKGAGPGLKA